jgi:hypothetical protein
VVSNFLSVIFFIIYYLSSDLITVYIRFLFLSLPLCLTTGNRGPLNVTIVQVGRGNGGSGDGGSDLLRLEPPLDLRPTPSPLSDTSATLQSDNNDTLAGGEKGSVPLP